MISMCPSSARDPIAVASFDVFDTVIMRSVARPTDVFVIVRDRLAAEGLLASHEADRWLATRLRAENAVRQSSTREEIVFDEIVLWVANEMEFAPELSAATRRIELEVERSTWRAVPAGLLKVQAARRAGKQIVFLSDMYLPVDEIRHVLLSLGIACRGDRVMVSSQSGVTKYSGNAYSRLAAELNVSTRAIEHLGDNRYSDLRMARRQGVRADLFTDCRLSDAETWLADASPLPARTRGLLAGAIRAQRVALSPGVSSINARQRSIVAVATSVVATVLLAYTSWVLRQARAAGRPRLLFLARDGQLPMRIADALSATSAARSITSGLTWRYVYASRQAWFPAAMQDLDAFDAAWLFSDGPTGLSFASFCARAGVEPERLARLLPPSLVAATREGFVAETQSELTRILFEDGRVRALLLESAQRQRHLAARYIEHVTDGDAGGSCLVDVGWNGNLQRAFERITGQMPSCGLYLGLIRRPSIDPASSAFAWLFDQPMRRGMWLRPVALLEQFFEADHGTTLGYEGRLLQEPPAARLASSRNEAALAWGLELQQRVVTGVCTEFLRNAQSTDLEVLAAEPGAATAAKLIERLVSAPEFDAAEHFGDFPKSNNQNHDDARPLARRVTFATALPLAFGLDRMVVPTSRWPVGSLVRSGFGWLVPVRQLRDRLASVMKGTSLQWTAPPWKTHASSAAGALVCESASPAIDHVTNENNGVELDVSVIIPAYNVQRYIRRAIDSALAQSGVSVEVIVVDDGSTDGTRTVVESIDDERVVLMALERNGGVSCARNAGLKRARGDWVAVLDGDDRFAPERLSRLLKAAQSSGAHMIVDDLLVEYEDGRQSHAMLKKTLTAAGAELSPTLFIERNLFFRSPSLGYVKPVIRRDYLIAQGVQYEPSMKIGEDFHFILALLSCGARCRIVNEPLYFWTWRSDSCSKQLTMDHVVALEAAMVRFWPRLPPSARKAAARRLASIAEMKAYIGMRRAVDERRFLTAVRWAAVRPLALRHVLRQFLLRAGFGRLLGLPST